MCSLAAGCMVVVSAVSSLYLFSATSRHLSCFYLNPCLIISGLVRLLELFSVSYLAYVYYFSISSQFNISHIN